MEVIERLYTDKIRVWDVYVDISVHIGVVKFNKESENMSFKMRPNESHMVKHVVRAMDIVKSRLVDEVLLATTISASLK